MARITAPWSRPLEANHIVNVPPNQQATFQGSYLMAGIDVGKPGQDGFHANTWYNVESSAQVGVPPFTNARPATGNNGSDYPIGQVLYGLLNTNEAGWTYDPASKLWFKDVPDIQVGGAGAGPLPPGIAQGGIQAGGLAKTHRYLEFSVAADGQGYFTAKTPATSANSAPANPHPGISIINPPDGDRIYSGLSPADLDLDEYTQRGWSGLGQYFIAWEGTDGSPADDELSDAMDRVESSGGNDTVALKALARVGVQPPASYSGTGGQGSLGAGLEDIGRFLQGL